MATTFQTRDEKDFIVEERDGYRYPPGLKLNLPLYLSRKFFKPGNPILLFEHLAATYGRVAHYKIGPSHIIFVNDPESDLGDPDQPAAELHQGAHAEADEDSAGRGADYQRRGDPQAPAANRGACLSPAAHSELWSDDGRPRRCDAARNGGRGRRSTSAPR